MTVRRRKRERLYKDFYRDSFFVRLVEGSPDINWVKTTNFCDIGFAVRGRQLVVFCAIDNLVKGAAGQAVQNMNLMFGLDEKDRLDADGGESMKEVNLMMTLDTTAMFEESTTSEEQFQLATYKKLPLAAVSGRGSWLPASEGERYPRFVRRARGLRDGPLSSACRRRL